MGQAQGLRHNPWTLPSAGPQLCSAGEAIAMALIGAPGISPRAQLFPPVRAPPSARTVPRATALMCCGSFIIQTFPRFRSPGAGGLAVCMLLPLPGCIENADAPGWGSGCGQNAALGLGASSGFML